MSTGDKYVFVFFFTGLSKRERGFFLKKGKAIKPIEIMNTFKNEKCVYIHKTLGIPEAASMQ